MKYYCLLFIALLSTISYSQNDISHYVAEYDTTNSIDRKMELTYLFFAQLKSENEDSAIYYANDLHAMGLEFQRKDVIMLSNLLMVQILQSRSLMDEAKRNLEGLIAYYKEQEDDTLLADAYNLMGNQAYMEGQVDNAVHYYLRSLDYAEESGITKFKMPAIYNLTIVYGRIEEYEKAEQYIEEYIAYYEEVDRWDKLGNAYGAKGELLMNMGQVDYAIEYLQKSMEFALSKGYLGIVGNGYTNMGIAAFLSDRKEESERYFKLALAYRLKDDNQFLTTESYYNLGDFYYALEEMDSSIFYYLKSNELAEKYNFLGDQKDALVQLEKVYENRNQKDKQIEVLKKIIEINEKLNKEKKNKELFALKTNYDRTQVELKDSGEKREKKLYSEVLEYKSIFNTWLGTIVTIIIVVSLGVYLVKRRQSIPPKKE